MVSRTYGWITAVLSPVIVVAWVAAVVAAWMFLPALGGSASAPLGDIVPEDAEALGAQQRAFERFGTTLSSDTLIVQRNPEGLSEQELRAAAKGSLASLRGQMPADLKGVWAAVPLVNAPLPGVKWGEENTTILTYLFLGDDLNLVEREAAADRYTREVLRPAAGTTAGTTGAGPARLQQFREIDDVLPIITIATVLVIALIVAVHFRSVLAPLVTLLTAGIAYVIAIRVLAWTGEQVGVTVPSEIEPVLVVLLLGLVTDYTIFFMSETRRRLQRGEPRVAAARRATARIAPIVLTAGILVAAGAASLLAGRMEFFRVFGPGLAASALAVTVVCVTLVPALMVLLGPRLFGRGAPAPEDDGRFEAPRRDVLTADTWRRREGWRLRASGVLGALRASRTAAERDGGRVGTLFGARMLSARPAAAVVTLLTVGALVFAALGARQGDLSVSHISSLPADSEPRAAADAAARGLAVGVIAPTEVVVEGADITRKADELARLQDALAARDGIAAVIGPKQATSAEPIDSFVLAPDGGAARFAVILGDEPTGADAVDTLGALREDMPRLLRAAGLPADSRVEYAGETALAQETVDSIVEDLGRVAIAAALVTFLALALFLRSLVAPLLLLIGSVLAFAAAFGITALLVPGLFGGDEIVYYVPLVGGVLLVALGSDYNVFIAGRIREEAARRRLREAIAVAAPSASRAITVAGITLAATFALLALVPLRPFRELALLMTLGVLIDALLVRPVLIPALIALAGRAAWWPGNPRKPAPARDFLRTVARLSGQTLDDARRITEATLATLAERVPAREARELAAQLPEGVNGPLVAADGECSTFGADEFVRRVAARAGEAPTCAALDVRAVVGALEAALPQTELDYVRAALSEDYRPLFGGADRTAGDPAPVAG